MARAVAVGKGRSWIWAQGLACGLLVATAAPLAFVLAVVLVPSAVVWMLAPGEGRRLGGMLLIYGVAGALPWLDALWGAARNWAACLDLLAGMRLLGVCWAAQGAGWLLGEIVPMVVRMVLEGRVRARVSRLREAREKLQAEWGLPMDEPPDPR